MNATTATTKRDRYIITQINGKFVITDSTLSTLYILTDQAKHADNTNPAHMKFFGMDYDTALGMKTDLNNRFHS